MEGYERLITYQLSLIIYDLTWDFVPQYYPLKEDYRQRDQLKQAARSIKQNISEGSAERSFSSKLKLYDVAKASSRELLEDYRDILRREGLAQWQKNDPRLFQLRKSLEIFPPNPSNPPTFFSVSRVLEGIRGNQEGNRGKIDIITNYLIDLLLRLGYLMDQQIRSVERKHETEGGYNEKLLKKRLEYRRSGGNFSSRR